MLQERREQAMNRYPVNDQGLLARFSPRTQPPTQTSPAAQEPSHTRAHSVEPSSPPKQLDRVLQSVKEDSPSDICVSTDAETLKPAAALDLREEMSVDVPLAPMGVGRGRSEVSTERPFRIVQSAFNPLPTIGRGALLHMLQAQNLCGKQPVGWLQLQCTPKLIILLLSVTQVFKYSDVMKACTSFYRVGCNSA